MFERSKLLFLAAVIASGVLGHFAAGVNPYYSTS